MTCLGRLEDLNFCDKPVRLTELQEVCSAHVLELDFWESHFEKLAAKKMPPISFRGEEISRKEAFELIYYHGIVRNDVPGLPHDFECATGHQRYGYVLRYKKEE